MSKASRISEARKTAGKEGGKKSATVKANNKQMLGKTAQQNPEQTGTQPQPQLQPQRKKEPSADADSSSGGDPPADHDADAKAETAGGDEVREAFNAYNATAERLGLPLAKNLTDERRKKVRARLRASGGLPVWHDALERLAASSFLTGKTDRGFLADLDFVCQAKSFQRLIEGFYADKTAPPNGTGNGHAPVVEDDDRWAARLQYARKHQVWSRKDWGPWPNEANCRAPLHLIESDDGEGWVEFQGDGR